MPSGPPPDDASFCPLAHTHGWFEAQSDLETHLASEAIHTKAEVAAWCAALTELMVGPGGTGRHCCRLDPGHGCFNSKEELEDHYEADHPGSELADSMATEIVRFMGGGGSLP